MATGKAAEKNKTMANEPLTTKSMGSFCGRYISDPTMSLVSIDIETLPMDQSIDTILLPISLGRTLPWTKSMGEVDVLGLFRPWDFL